MLKRLIMTLLAACAMTFACSSYFSADFCREIDFWNGMSEKYHYGRFEISPNWIMIADGYRSFDFTIRF